MLNEDNRFVEKGRDEIFEVSNFDVVSLVEEDTLTALEAAEGDDKDEVKDCNSDDDDGIEAVDPALRATAVFVLCTDGLVDITPDAVIKILGPVVVGVSVGAGLPGGIVDRAVFVAGIAGVVILLKRSSKDHERSVFLFAKNATAFVLQLKQERDRRSILSIMVHAE